MSTIPQDIDQLMWQIAERGDAKAAADFVERFPHLKESMGSRMQMVGGMRSMRGAIAPATIPAFSPKFLFRKVPAWRRYGPSGLGLLSLAAASFYITQNLVTPLPEAEIFREVPAPQPRASRPLPESTAGAGPARSGAPPSKSPYRPLESDGPKPFETSKAEKPDLHLTSDGVPLVKVIQQVASEGKLKLIIPPEFPNPSVTVDMRGKTSMELLSHLGAQYGFKAFEQGSNEVLVIPLDTPQESPQ